MTRKQLHKRAADYFVGRNFMTPDVEKCGFKGDYAYEISVGTGLSRQLIYGVTIRNKFTGEDDGKSQLFQSLDAAQSYVRWLGHKED
jgi:hypothetical protein